MCTPKVLVKLHPVPAAVVTDTPLVPFLADGIRRDQLAGRPEARGSAGPSTQRTAVHLRAITRSSPESPLSQACTPSQSDWSTNDSTNARSMV
jgi:hypothetical protein